MISEGIEIMGMVPAGVVLVQEDLEAVIFVVILEGIRVAVKKDVVNDLCQDIEVVLIPKDLETAAEVFRPRLDTEPQLVNRVPGGLLPTGLLRPAVDVDP